MSDTPILFRSDIPVELVDVHGDDLKVAHAAWVSTLGERSEEGEPGRVEGLINFLMQGRHGSPFEHCTMTWRVKAPIFVWREHHRHRIASYNEESGRYKQLDPEFYIPSWKRNLIQVGKPGAYDFIPGTEAQYQEVRAQMEWANETAYAAYERLLGHGIAKEVARMCLPVNIFSTCYVTMNLRALMNFLSLRTKDSASQFPSFPQREIEMVAEQYEASFAKHFPIVHAAFTYNGRVSP